MPKITMRVKLDSENIITFGARVVCCNEANWISDVGAEPFAVHCCQYCGRPLAVVGLDRRMYFVGEQILGREVDAGDG
ncbi:hypothetical protein J19TS2_31000 [Cohnella xylanilytica]|uniref:hypothetical protein n=1 Tax=Cohnella xylanilytica TaxID=557555 RepID=UPI001AFE097E|nr:hypothetical protein [Cohnella xylanilytica]GIO13545.1 hypothetical protein J19TS2_31000 [Cohnella xylanilytica]